MKHNFQILLAVSCLGGMVLSCNSQKKNAATATTHTHASTDVAHTHNANSSTYFGEYVLKDQKYGTETSVVIENAKRIMKTNSLPNHDVGQFPNKGNPNTISAQSSTYEFPLNPVYTGNPTWARQPGVALNGVKFEPETNERFVCETGEHFKIEAKQQLINLGLDFNNAHVQPTGAYHYHATPTGVVQAFDNGKDLVHIGFAMDGFPMYYSKSGKYKPSYRLIQAGREGANCEYNDRQNVMKKNLQGTTPDGTFVQDWEYVAELGDLDKCNGIKIDGAYAYLVTDEYPYISRYLNGAFTEKRGGPPGENGQRGQRQQNAQRQQGGQRQQGNNRPQGPPRRN